MKYAVVDGKLTHVNKVPKGTNCKENLVILIIL